MRQIIFCVLCAVLSFDVARSADKNPVGEVSLQARNGYLIVPVYIFDHWRWFAIDTAGSFTTLHSTFTNHLRLVSSARMETLRERVPFVDFYNGQKFFLGRLYPSPEYFLASDSTSLEELSNATVDGLLAQNVLTNYQVILDLSASNVTFRTNVSEPEPGGLPFRTEGKGFAFVASTTNGKHLQLGIDTLNSGAIALNADDWTKAFPVEANKTSRVMAADRYGKFSEQNEARLPLLKISENIYTNLICRRLTDKSALSTIGSEFLQRNRVVLDYPNAQIRFEQKKNAEYLEEDMSGLHLKWVRSSAIIAAIDPDGPGQKSGLAEGDEILWIDGKRVSRLTPLEIGQIFRRGDNVRIQIEVLHGTEEVTNTIILKRRI